jgi:hypothetical protein
LKQDFFETRDKKREKRDKKKEKKRQVLILQRIHELKNKFILA